MLVHVTSWTSSYSPASMQSLVNGIKLGSRGTSVRRIFKTRLFGTKQGSGIEGSIFFSNDQDVVSIDEEYLVKSLTLIREILDYPTYDVTLVLGDDTFIKDLNREYRNMDNSTDILSFPFYDEIDKPGVLPDPDFDFEDYYCLGDMMISVPYVLRQIEEDKMFFAQNSKVSEEVEYIVDENDPLSIKLADERGVSAAMAKEYNIERRISLLLIHGMLHLLGYDHIDDEDYLIMAKREEEVMEEWKRRI